MIEKKRQDHKRKSTKRDPFRAVRTGLLFGALFLFAGCANEEAEPLVAPGEIPYAETERETIVVERGDLVPVLEEPIRMSGYEEESYRIEVSKMEELTGFYDVGSVRLLVDVGDRVEENEVLLSFDSETLEKQEREIRAKKEEDRLKIEHYENLTRIEATPYNLPDMAPDYTLEIDKLKEDMTLCDLYLEDIRRSYDEISLRAKKAGIVSFVDESVKEGSLPAGMPILRVVSGDGYYVMDRPDPETTTEEFSPGEIFTAKSGAAEFEVEVVEPEGEPESKVCFRLLSENATAEETLTLYREQEMVKDVVYLETRALIPYNGEYYVYLRQEDGSFRAKKVRTGERMGNFTVIKEGLNEGDEVSLGD